MAKSLSDSGMVEALYKLCGSLEVARDLVARSGHMYVSASDSPNGRVLELIADATALIGRAVETLYDDLTSPAA